MKLCINCKHYERDYCTRWRITDPVLGEEIVPVIYARTERCSNLPVSACNTPDPCGPEGKHWVEPPPPPPAPKPAPWWRRVFGMANVMMSQPMTNAKRSDGSSVNCDT